MMMIREAKLRLAVLSALAAITPFLSRETVLEKADQSYIIIYTDQDTVLY
jgi:hypothetical protein